MRTFLKYLIIILVLLALIAVGLMALSPSQLKFSEEITVKAPANMVFNMVNDFKKWESWSPWQEMDPDAVHTFTDKSAGVGAKWGWKGNKEVGEGSQSITESVPGQKIRTSLKFGGWDLESFSDWTFKEKDGKTTITWDFQGGETPFVFRPFNLMMKSGQKKTYKKGLANIKNLVEDRAKNKIYGGYKITEVYQGTKNYIMSRQVVDIDKVQQFYTQNLTALFMKTQGADLEMDGMPSSLFYSWDDVNGKTDMAVAFPLKEPTNIPGTIAQTISDGKALVVDYYGDSDKMAPVHIAIQDYMRDHNLLINYPIVQEKITDPEKEKDPTKWLTKVTYYITNSSQ